MMHSHLPARSLRAELERLAQLARGIANACTQIIDNGDDPPLTEADACSLAETARWGAEALAAQMQRLRRTLGRRGATIDGAAVGGLASLADGAAAVLVLVRQLGAKMPDRRHALFGLAAHGAEALAADAGALADLALSPPPPAAPRLVAAEDAERDDPAAGASGPLPVRLH